MEQTKEQMQAEQIDNALVQIAEMGAIIGQLKRALMQIRRVEILTPETEALINKLLS